MSQDEEKYTEVIKKARGICHDINQPLTVLLARSELLLLEVDEENPMFGSLDQIRNNSKKLADLVIELRSVLKSYNADEL